MWIKKFSTKTPFGEKRMKVWKYKDLQLFDIKKWITICKQKNTLCIMQNVFSGVGSEIRTHGLQCHKLTR